MTCAMTGTQYTDLASAHPDPATVDRWRGVFVDPEKHFEGGQVPIRTVLTYRYELN